MRKNPIPEEITRFKILKYLADPANAEAGVTGAWRVLTAARPEKHIDGERVLGELVDEGLVERRPTEYHRTAKPYFVTQAGRDYLESSSPQMKEMLAALGRKESWVGKVSDDSLERIISRVIRDQPEFHDALPRRINEVTREITEAINQAAGQKR